MFTAVGAHPVVDVARVLVSLIAAGTMAQLAVMAWQDRRNTRDRHRTPAQVALLLSLALISVDSTMRVGEQVVPHLLGMRVAIVFCATWYVLDRQGYLKGRR